MAINRACIHNPTASHQYKRTQALYLNRRQTNPLQTRLPIYQLHTSTPNVGSPPTNPLQTKHTCPVRPLPQIPQRQCAQLGQQAVHSHSLPAALLCASQRMLSSLPCAMYTALMCARFSPRKPPYALCGVFKCPQFLEASTYSQCRVYSRVHQHLTFVRSRIATAG